MPAYLPPGAFAGLTPPSVEEFAARRQGAFDPISALWDPEAKKRIQRTQRYAMAQGAQPQVLGGGVPMAGAAALLPGVLGTIATGAVAGWGAYQALGGGEGEGLFGLNLLGGNGGYIPGTNVPLGGPGAAEPPAAWIEKEWQVSYNWGHLNYYMLRLPNGTRRIAMRHGVTGKWKSWVWRAPHLAVIGKNMPSHKQLTRLKRNLKRHTADARTILQIASPASFAKVQGYRKPYRGKRR